MRIDRQVDDHRLVEAERDRLARAAGARDGEVVDLGGRGRSDGLRQYRQRQSQRLGDEWTDGPRGSGARQRNHVRHLFFLASHSTGITGALCTPGFDAALADGLVTVVVTVVPAGAAAAAGVLAGAVSTVVVVVVAGAGAT